jgi:hypothetical protein
MWSHNALRCVFMAAPAAAIFLVVAGGKDRAARRLRKYLLTAESAGGRQYR